MSDPLISVIVPAHNNADTLDIALLSIMHQTYKNLEIIVVDDNSKDDTKEIVERLAAKDARVRYYPLAHDDADRFSRALNRNTNAGYAARNLGFTKAHGDLITFQDADDASLLNRIEIQCKLLTTHHATHITTNWTAYRNDLVNTTSNAPIGGAVMKPHEIYKLSQEAKGMIAKLSPWLNSIIPFRWKRLRFVHKLFFGTLAPYPGAGNSPLLRREVVEKVKFRKLKHRIWPSFMGRGADRDFNFQVAETFKDSYFFDIPLYLWRK